MSLGSRINQQRAAHGLSQVDLADLLEVSRQSVSKWETDGSVPDLDKLVKMCEVFQVSLDWLVLGKTPAAPPAAPQPASLQLPALTREMIGGALAALGLLALIVMAAAQTILSGVLLALPFLACGGLCFLIKQKRHLLLGCGWILWFSLFCGILSSVHSDRDPISTFFILLSAILSNGSFYPQSALAFLELIGLVVLFTFTFAYDQIFPPEEKKP